MATACRPPSFRYFPVLYPPGGDLASDFPRNPREGCGWHSVGDLRPPWVAPGRPLSLALRASIRPADVWSTDSDGPAQEPPPRAGVLHAPSGPGGQAKSCSCSPAALGWVFLSLSGVSKDFDGPAYEWDTTKHTTHSRHRTPTTPERRVGPAFGGGFGPPRRTSVLARPPLPCVFARWFQQLPSPAMGERGRSPYEELYGLPPHSDHTREKSAARIQQLSTRLSLC
jgi:hypothetical protein